MLNLPTEVKVYRHLMLLADIMVGRWAEGRQIWKVQGSFSDIVLYDLIFFLSKPLYLPVLRQIFD